MGIESRGNSSGDREPAKEAAVEAGTDTSYRSCIEVNNPNTVGTFKCEFADDCGVIAITDQIADNTGDSGMKTIILLGDKCVAVCLGEAILPVTSSPEA